MLSPTIIPVSLRRAARSPNLTTVHTRAPGWEHRPAPDFGDRRDRDGAAVACMGCRLP